jgi:hypothetical protein
VRAASADDEPAVGDQYATDNGDGCGLTCSERSVPVAISCQTRPGPSRPLVQRQSGDSKAGDVRDGATGEEPFSNPIRVQEPGIPRHIDQSQSVGVSDTVRVTVLVVEGGPTT